MATELTGRSPVARRPPRPPRRFRRLLWRTLQLLGLGAAALLVWGLIAANPSLPDSPELRGVSLALPRAQPGSAQLARLLRTRGVYNATPAALAAARDALAAGRWPADPRRVAAELAALDPPLDRFREALLAPGCLPPVSLEETLSTGGVSYVIPG